MCNANKQHKDHGLICFYNASTQTKPEDGLSFSRGKGQRFEIMNAKHQQKGVLIRS